MKRLFSRNIDNKGRFIRGLVALLADPDRGFEHQKNIVAAFFDAGDDFGDLFGIGERFVDGFAQFFHELLELLIHAVPLFVLPSNDNRIMRELLSLLSILLQLW